MKNNPLLDKDFLKKLDSNRNKTIFAKIILLSNDEYPISQIEGRITSGSINIDGKSIIRRTCSLTLTAIDNENIDLKFLGLKNKFKLEIGVVNNIDSNYDDIIWFPQGIFVITSLNTTLNASSYNISISGKDKMCLLNGEIGGNLPAQINFGEISSYEKTGRYIISNVNSFNYATGKYYIKNGESYILSYEDFNPNEDYYENEKMIVKIKLPIKRIIKEALNTYAEEPLSNIIINDVDDYGKELLSYRGNEPLFMLRDKVGTIRNSTFNKEQKYWIKTNSGTYEKIEIGNEYSITYDKLVSEVEAQINPTIFYPSKDNSPNLENPFTVVKIEYGETVGYRQTELTYPDDLIANIGESITSILDKIVTMLGDFEYFYDIDGRFIFQEKKTYVNSSWNNLVTTNEEQYADSAAYNTSYSYSFEGNNLLTAITINPSIGNLKNDYSVWGTRKNASGNDIPIHMRYAIDNKPIYYKSLEITNTDIVNALEKIAKQESKIYITKDFPKEKRTSDMLEYDWREIIYQMASDYFKYHSAIEDFQQKVSLNNFDYYPSGITGYEKYYTDMEGFWREIYDPNTDSEEYDNNTHWHINVIDSPELLKFWIDFIESPEGELGKYSIPTIGHRPKVVNDSKVSAIYYKDTPSVLFVSNSEEISEIQDLPEFKGFTYIYAPNFISYFGISGQGKSAKSALDTLLYNNAYLADSITLTSIPVYYLSPNTRILVNDEIVGINGEYIITKLTIPLAYNGTMSLTASKAVNRIY